MAKIYHKGSNLFDYADLTQDRTITSDGTISNYSGRFATTTPIDVDGLQIVELTFTADDAVRVIFATKNNGTLIDRQTGLRNGAAIDVSSADELYLAFYLSGGAPLEIADVDDISVNSTWENYTPRFNAPILTANPLNGINNYKDTLNLATGACSRKIRKIVFDGTENWYKRTDVDNSYTISYGSGYGAEYRNGYCTHATNRDSATSLRNGECYFGVSAFSIRYDNLTTLEDFKTWVAGQSTNGTPLTMWYVLTDATTETITVPTGLSGTVEGFTIAEGTPSQSNPVYPSCNEVITWTTKTDKEYADGSWGSEQRALAIQRQADLKKVLAQEDKD